MALSFTNLLTGKSNSKGTSASRALDKKLAASSSVLNPLKGFTPITQTGALGAGIRATPINTASQPSMQAAQKQPVLPARPPQGAPPPQPSYSRPVEPVPSGTRLDEPVSYIASANTPIREAKKGADWDRMRARQRGVQQETTPPTYGGLVGDLVSRSRGTDTVKEAREKLLKFDQSVADTTKNIYDDETSARVMQGRDQAIQVANASKRAALAQNVASALDETQQGLGALSTAAGLAQPVQIAPGSTLASPITGGTVAGGLGGYANYQTAEQVMSLIRQYPDAGYVYDQTKTPQENLQAFQGGALQNSPTYQRSTYGVPGQQSIAGAAVVQAAQQGYNQSVQDYQAMNTQFANADGQAELLLESLQQGGINPADARFANQTVNSIKRQLASADLKRFETALAATKSAYSNLLAAGGGTIPTEATEAYNTILDSNASLGQFQAALQQLRREGQTRLATQANQVNTYFSQLQGASQPQGGTVGGSGNIWSF